MDRLLSQLRKGMNPRTYVLVGLLIAVLLWIQSLDAREKALRARASAARAGAVPAAAVAAVPVRRAQVDAVSPDWGEDPFARRVSVAGGRGAASAPRRTDTASRPGAAEGLFLQGVMSGPMGRSALINGRVVREGTRIGSREVLRIGNRSVTLLKNGTVTTLHLKGGGR